MANNFHHNTARGLLYHLDFLFRYDSGTTPFEELAIHPDEPTIYYKMTNGRIYKVTVEEISEMPEVQE